MTPLAGTLALSLLHPHSSQIPDSQEQLGSLPPPNLGIWRRRLESRAGSGVPGHSVPRSSPCLIQQPLLGLPSSYFPPQYASPPSHPSVSILVT